MKFQPLGRNHFLPELLISLRTVDTFIAGADCVPSPACFECPHRLRIPEKVSWRALISVCAITALRAVTTWPPSQRRDRKARSSMAQYRVLCYFSSWRNHLHLSQSHSYLHRQRLWQPLLEIHATVSQMRTNATLHCFCLLTLCDSSPWPSVSSLLNNNDTCLLGCEDSKGNICKGPHNRHPIKASSLFPVRQHSNLRTQAWNQTQTIDLLDIID